ncbi:hypothetical protein ABI_23640 [Asticcacaulis biprosthecium C19]|uniref:Uncharacterized protein n=1 Tax=Asticcacaulis biprosthecium C19 TaxID=715226 RepID=F4QNP5_9CAUL|nr:hypothetical protein ABI_23640 [Asticcacaulis biprosthecium C19]
MGSAAKGSSWSAVSDMEDFITPKEASVSHKARFLRRWYD